MVGFVEVADREELERAIRARFDAGDMADAVAIAIRGYGPEVFGLITAFQRDTGDAEEVWSRVTERLWKGIAQFAWQSSFRTWFYAIARNTSMRYRDEVRRRAAHQVQLGTGAEEVLAERPRTATASYLTSGHKHWLAAIRDRLPEDDRMLLVLRVDKGLGFSELAVVMHENDEAPLDAEGQKREAARLRKRFQLLKERIQAMRADAGERGD